MLLFYICKVRHSQYFLYVKNVQHLKDRFNYLLSAYDTGSETYRRSS